MKTTAITHRNSKRTICSAFRRHLCTLCCFLLMGIVTHFVLRYQKMKAEIAKKVLWTTHGGLSLELAAVIESVDAMAIYHLVCSVGWTCLVRLLTSCHLSLLQYFIADEKHSR